ncbi:KH domain-containing protein [Candidatus Woesearchaeota archaeon]|nr:KH domain-containing protein [Candidatus Woesearchaeota archaeon]
MEYSYELKLPKERIAVLIGKKGEVKKRIEEETKTEIKVDSKEGDIFIKGKDALSLFTAREVITAIGRGFNPEIAELLLKGDYGLEILNITEFTGKNQASMIRLKGRVIGREGKSRKIIEELTECYISVYGKTIAIIGKPEDLANARRAVESLLQGSPHSNVYKWLEKRRREIKRQGIIEGLK